MFERAARLYLASYRPRRVEELILSLPFSERGPILLLLHEYEESHIPELSPPSEPRSITPQELEKASEPASVQPATVQGSQCPDTTLQSPSERHNLYLTTASLFRDLMADYLAARRTGDVPEKLLGAIEEIHFILRCVYDRIVALGGGIGGMELTMELISQIMPGILDSTISPKLLKDAQLGFSELSVDPISTRTAMSDVLSYGRGSAVRLLVELPFYGEVQGDFTFVTSEFLTVMLSSNLGWLGALADSSWLSAVSVGAGYQYLGQYSQFGDGTEHGYSYSISERRLLGTLGLHLEDPFAVQDLKIYLGAGGIFFLPLGHWDMDILGSEFEGHYPSTGRSIPKVLWEASLQHPRLSLYHQGSTDSFMPMRLFGNVRIPELALPIAEGTVPSISMSAIYSRSFVQADSEAPQFVQANRLLASADAFYPVWRISSGMWADVSLAVLAGGSAYMPLNNSGKTEVQVPLGISVFSRYAGVGATFDPLTQTFALSLSFSSSGFIPSSVFSFQSASDISSYADMPNSRTAFLGTGF